MRMSQVFLMCGCLLGTAQFASSQTKPTAIPGFYNPTTGKFTTNIESGAKARPNATAAATGTPTLFREQFNITITNYDQPSSYQAVCSVSMGGGDTAGSYSEAASVAATPSGNGWTCSVPVLTLWNLDNFATDSIYATVTVTVYPQGATAVNFALPAYREGTQSLSLTQPGNTQTVVNELSFVL